MRIFCIVSYNGGHYYGWEKQIGQISIEEVIEKVLSKLYDQEINIYASGRTDAGVHAYGQTFHFDVDNPRYDEKDLMYRMNAMLPMDICIQKIEFLKDENFHARFSATEKIYEYRFSLNNKNPFRYELVYPLSSSNFDETIYKQALAKFIGKHNFINFTSKEEDLDNFIREIFKIEVSFDGENNEFVTRISGDGFMRYQIRYIIGTSLAVACQKEDIGFIDNKLNETKIRSISNYKAPAQGLYLVEVKYK